MAIKINGDNSTSAVGLGSGDDDSGIKPGTNQVEIVTGGTARVTVNDSLTTISKLSVTDTVTAAGSAIICGDNPNGAVNVGGRMRNIGQLQLTSNGGTLFQGMDQGNATPNVQIEANGQAEFKNRVKIHRTDSDTSAALLILNQAGSVNQHIFYGNGTVSLVGGKVAIDTNGNLDLRASGGNLFFDSGKGVSFADTADSSGTMTSELLDDYEEGTFTPSLEINNSSTGITYNVRSGIYTKVGRVVNVNIRIQTSNNGSNSGAVRISGLPFTVKHTNVVLKSFTFTASGLSGEVSPWATVNTTVMPLYYGLGTYASFTDSNWPNNGDMNITGFYFTD